MTTPATYWRRRVRSKPMPHDQAARQGDISRLAFEALGKERAMAFLNTDNPFLGGRPLALAIKSDAGRLEVEAELVRLARG
jgi:uncharacterized protein (DUF2384 family)